MSLAKRIAAALSVVLFAAFAFGGASVSNPPFIAGGDLSGTPTSQTVIGLQGRGVSASAPSTGQALAWSGSAWAPTNGASSEPTYSSYVTYASNAQVYTGSPTLTRTAGNDTVGVSLTTTAAGATVMGVLYNWNVATEGSAESVKFSVWNNGSGLVVGTATTSITLSGIGYVAFASPVSLSASTAYTLGAYQGSAYQTGWAPVTSGVTIGRGIGHLTAVNLFSAGDARPTSSAGTERYGFLELVPQ